MEPPQCGHKPNSVPFDAPRSRAAPQGDDHSSSPAIAGRIKRPTRRLRTGRPQTPPYLVLLRAGFCLPSALRRTRCALTAPFHPYPPSPFRAGAGGMFSVPLVLQVALTGGYPAHCPAEFGLSSLRRVERRSSGSLRRNVEIVRSRSHQSSVVSDRFQTDNQQHRQLKTDT